MKPNQDPLIDFVHRTTEAIAVISEATKQNAKTSEDIKNMIYSQSVRNSESFTSIEGKVDGLLMMFKWVVLPLVSGILALVGVKIIFGL